MRVRLAAAGVCHSDLSLSNGTLRQPVPAVLGHEGAGTVIAVGDGVTTVAPGDQSRAQLGALLRQLPLLRAGRAVAVRQRGDRRHDPVRPAR